MFSIMSSKRTSVGPMRPYEILKTPNTVDSRYTLIESARYTTTSPSARPRFTYGDNPIPRPMTAVENASTT